MIKVTCSKCGKKLQAPDESDGKKGECPDCGSVFEVKRELKLKSKEPKEHQPCNVKPSNNRKAHRCKPDGRKRWGFVLVILLASVPVMIRMGVFSIGDKDFDGNYISDTSGLELELNADNTCSFSVMTDLGVRVIIFESRWRVQEDEGGIDILDVPAELLEDPSEAPGSYYTSSFRRKWNGALVSGGGSTFKKQ